MWIWLACQRGPEPALETSDLSPLGPNRSTWPAGEAEEMTSVTGVEGDVTWANGLGYVHAPLEAVWDAALDPEVGVDRRVVSEWSVVDDPVEGLDASYRVTQEIPDLITVEYELWWRHERQGGSDEAPDRVVIVYDKTDGTQFIESLRGSLVLERGADPDVTEVDLQEEIVAPRQDGTTQVAFQQDFFASLVEVAHGRPLPDW
ncbi:MAG: hypothetical protein ABMA64_07505 [Myxococcota bacterium]